MLTCPAPPAYVQIDGRHQTLVPPETPNVPVRPGQTILIPLYDGKIASYGDWRSVLRYEKAISVPPYLCFRLSPYTAGSHRAAVFRVVGYPGQKTFVPVELRLAAMRETCVSCRMLHFFVRVQR